MKDIIMGTAYCLGDNIDTDQIIPAEYLVYSLNDPVERKKYGQLALSGVPEKNRDVPFVDEGQDVSKFSIIIAGKNFGCGSSREHAPFALKEAGVKAVVTQSYARIFYRNSVDGGFFVPCEYKDSDCEMIKKIKTGDSLKIDLNNSTLTHELTGTTIKLNSMEAIMGILKSGNIFSYAKERGLYE